MSLIVASVLKSGGVYTPAHVRILQAMVKRNLPLEHRFTVLTDLVGAFTEDRAINAVPLPNAWPGWWAKVGLFEPLMFNRHTRERVLYLDLDSIVVGDLTPLVTRTEPWLILKDFYRRPPRHPKAGYQSSCMMWTAGDMDHVYEAFAADPTAAIGKHARLGDQGFLEEHAPGATFWEEDSSLIASYKVHCMGGKLPASARIVDFHGKIKPWAVTDRWAREHYHA